MSLPLCFASKILKIRIFLFEPNMVLGRSNKFFISYFDKIFVSSMNSKNFPKKYINNFSLKLALLRKTFYETEKVDDIEKYINLLVIGGSQGAKIFDTLLKKSIIKLSKRYSLKIYQQTSSVNFENYKKIL